MRGFSLIELMVTIFVAAILMAIALPQFRGTLQAHRLLSTASGLQGSVQYARTEAVLRATYVSVCATSDGATCSASNSYDSGWLVYAHPVTTTTASAVYSADASAGMQVLRVEPAPVQVSVRATDGAPVTFGQQGQLESVASRTNASQPMAFVACALTGGATALGQNSARVPGTRIGISPYGGIAASKLATTDACTP